MATQKQIDEARRRFTIRFKRAVLERIESERELRVTATSPAEINEARDRLIVTLASEGRSFAAILSAAETKADHARSVLGLTVADVAAAQLARERARKRPRAASAAR